MAAVVGRTADWALFLGIVLIGGVGSSWYMVRCGARASPHVTIGSWTTWPAAARSDADPYTRAHYARLGLLPLEHRIRADVRRPHRQRRPRPALVVRLHHRRPRTWRLLVVAFRLRCQGPPDPERHRSAHLYARHRRRSIPNGTFTVSLSRDPEPGNWLPVGGGGRLALVYTVIDLGVRAVSQDGEIEKHLPVIKRKSC